MRQSRVDQLQNALVDEIKRKEGFRSPAVESAFRTVPRHLFLPGVPLEEVYSDQAIVIKKDAENVALSSSSQPVLMAAMLESLHLRPGQRVLEIGTGTGYNAALLAHVVGEEGLVVTVDIDADLVMAARQHLQGAGYGHVVAMVADGGDGAPPFAPFDAILVTVGVWDIPPAWLAQLKPGGYLTVPVEFYGSQLCLAFQEENGYLHNRETIPCGFVSLQGAFAGPQTTRTLDRLGLLQLTANDIEQIDSDALIHHLRGRYLLHTTGISVDPRQIAYGLYFWLGIHSNHLIHLHAFDEVAESGLIPHLFSQQERYVATAGLFDNHGLGLLMRAADSDAAASSTFELWVVQYGDPQSATRLLALIADWDAAHRPHLDMFTVNAYPAHVAPSADTEGVVRKRWMHYHFTRHQPHP